MKELPRRGHGGPSSRAATGGNMSYCFKNQNGNAIHEHDGEEWTPTSTSMQA